MKEATRNAVLFPLSPSYAVTPHGDVVRISTGAILRPAPRNGSGYLAVSLWESGKGRSWFVHQIVALTFHGPRPSPKHDASHDDGNKLNNDFTNIRWKTKVENERDKIRHGTHIRGERNGFAKLSDAQVAEIKTIVATLPKSTGRCRLKKGALPELARKYGVTASRIRALLHPNHWSQAL